MSPTNACADRRGALEAHPDAERRRAFLRPLPREAAGLRLICIPHGGGGAQSYHAWADLLPDHVDLLAWRPPGRGPRRSEPPLESMAALTQAILAELDPWLDRPVALFGHSVGALIAFETAKALAAAGRTPLRLFLSGYAAPERAEAAAALHELEDDALWEAVASFGLAPALAAAGPELRALAIPAIRTDFQLAETHRVDPSAPPLLCPTLLMAGEADESAPPDSLDGWRRHLDGPIETQVFPGGHFFTESAQEAVLASISARLEADLAAAARPSILHGPPSRAPADKTLDQLFRQQAAKTPAAPAIEAADRRLSFAELDRLSDLLARRLARLGAGRDTLVGLHLETSADFMVGYLAALKAGAAYLPLDLALPEAALAETLVAMRPVAVVTRPSLLGKLPVAWRGAGAVALEPDWPARLAAEDDGAPVPFETARPDDLAYGVLSSGTTGAPKGVLCPHRGAVVSYWWRYRHLPYGEDEREAANVFFVWEALRPLLQGRPLYVIPDEIIYDPARLVDHLERHRVTRVLATPSLLEQVLNAAERGALGDLATRLSALSVVLLNGEVVATALWRRFRAALPHARLVNDYSISECHDVCHIDLTDWRPAADQSRAPAGRVMDGVSLYVLDEARRPVPWGATGEIYVGGSTLARGYLGLESETEARFLPDPFRAAPEARMFRTGDLGRLLPDGALEVTGREKFLIKLRGYSIVPGQVEAALCAHPAIGGAVLSPAVDPASGATEATVAFLSLSGSADVAEGALSETLRRELIAHLRARLPGYAVPARLVPLSPWPIDPASGKLDRKALPDAWTAYQARGDAGPSASADAEEDLIEALSALWAETLGQAPNGPEADFFEMGGHSLKAIELALGVEERLGLTIDVVDLFDRPRLKDMAEEIARRRSAARSAAPAAAAARPRRARSKTAGGDVAVLALAGRFPGAENDGGDLDAFWRLLAEGRAGLQRLDPAALDRLGVRPSLRGRPDYVPVAGHLRDIALFDPQLFGLSDREASLTDPQHRLFLESCWRALELAGYPPRSAEASLRALAMEHGRDDPEGGRVGVWAGCWLPLYLTHHLGGAAALNPGDPTGFHLAEVGNDKDYLASRVAYLLNLTGPAAAVQTSCSTGLVAIAEAAQALRDGRCDMALAGAASLGLPQGGYIAEPGHVGSPSGACRTFDAGADGVVFTDGVGVVALKRLEDAVEDGDPVVAVIKGFAVSSDGSGKAGFSAPSVRGQEATIAAALRDADAPARSVGLVEAHGTGTLLGDPIEVTALARAYGAPQPHGGARAEAGEEPISAAPRGSVALGSVKPNIGHCNIAAGVAGFAKAALALEKRFLPPTIGVETPNPKLGLDQSPFRLQTRAEPWRIAAGPRRAGVSSLGVGGVNCHMILEEPPAPRRRSEESETEPEALLLSARSADGLAALARAVASRLEDDAALDLAAVAETLRSGRETMPHRLAVPAPSLRQAPARLRAAADTARPALEPGQASDQASRRDSARDPAQAAASRPPRIAFVFPGHGAQHAVMGAGLHRSSPVFRDTFEECRALFTDLAAEAGDRLDLAALFDPDRANALLARPLGLQASVFSVQIAMAATLASAGLRPAAVSGHSLGEYAAAVVADMLDLEAAAALVAARAQATAAAPPGAMLAVSGAEPEILALAAEIGGLSVAGWNAPQELAIAGPLAAIDAFETQASGRGLQVSRLAAPRAFHSGFMEEAAATLREAARRAHAERPFRAPRTPFASTERGAWLSSEAPLPVDYWARQMRGPVRFRDAAALLVSGGIDVALDIGPGRSLGRLLAKTARETEGQRGEAAAARFEALGAMRHPKDAAPDLDALHRALGRLWERGQEIDWRGFRGAGPRPPRVALPGPRFERRRCWVEPRTPAADGSTAAAERGVARETLSPPERRLHLPGFARVAPAAEAARERWRWLALIDPKAPSSRDAEILHALAAAGDRVEISDLESVLGRAELAADRLLWLRGLEAEEAGAPTADLARFAAALSEKTRSATLFAISAGALAVGAERIRPHAACRLGPLLSLGQETPHAGVRALDLDPDQPTPIEALRRELRAETLRREPFCALRGPHLWVEEERPFTPDPGAFEAGRALLRGAGPIAITGGFGRIGLALANRLAPLGAPLLLVGRRPERGAAAVTRLRAAGARVETLAADVAAPGGAEQLVSTALARFGGLGAVFHAAGLADLKYLAETTAGTLAAEHAPKVAGTAALERALAALKRPPSVVALFSSLAAPLGGLGMSGYGGANRFLDLFAEAQARRGGPTRWLSIAWDDWDFEYQGAEQVGAWARTRAGLSLPVEEALDALETLLGTDGLGAALVAATPLAPRVERWRWQATRALPPGLDENEATQAATPSFSTEAGQNPLLTAVLDAYRATLGGEGISEDADFFDLGGDSLLATQLATRLSSAIAALRPGTPRPRIADIFDHPTPRRLATRLAAANASDGG